MRTLIIALALALCTSVSVAQLKALAADASPVLLFRLTDVDGSIDPPGLRMRNTGRTLTLCGSALFIGGIILMSGADELYYTASSGSGGVVEEGDPQGAFGLLMTTGGAGMMIPGIIFWSKGQKKYNRHLERESLSLSAGARGLGLRYTF